MLRQGTGVYYNSVVISKVKSAIPSEDSVVISKVKSAIPSEEWDCRQCSCKSQCPPGKARFYTSPHAALCVIIR